MNDQSRAPALGFSRGQSALFGSLLSLGGLFLIILALPFFLRSEPNADAQIQEVKVVLTEFAFEPGTFQFAVGDRVKFVVENRGQVTHEFRLTSVAASTEHAEAGHEGHDDATASTTAEEDMLVVAPGETQTLEIVFGVDTSFDLVACLLPGHFEAGMTRPLTVAGAMVADHDDEDMTDHDEETPHHDDEDMADHDEETPHHDG